MLVGACSLFAVCCSLSAVRCSLFVLSVRCLQYLVCGLLCFVCWALLDVRCLMCVVVRSLFEVRCLFSVVRLQFGVVCGLFVVY